MRDPAPLAPDADDPTPPARALARPYRLAPAAGLVLAMAALAVLLWAGLPAGETLALMSETGPVEELTASAYIAAALVPWWLRPRHAPWPALLAISIVMLAFGMRELDWHKLWTGTSVLRLSWYWSDAPMASRLAALAVMAPIAAAGSGLLLRYGPPTLRAAGRGEPPAVTTLWFVGVLIASKAIDRSLNVMVEWFDLHSPLWLIALQLALEETLELALPLLMALALWQLRAAQAASAKTVSTPV